MQQREARDNFGRVVITSRCCGSGTCRNFAPELLGEVPTASALRDGRRLHLLDEAQAPGAFTGVLRQPQNRADLLAARTAAAACPFGAIRVIPASGLETNERLPAPWSDYPKQLEDNVWALGEPSLRNFGARTYFIEEAGGVLVDPPQPTEEIFRWLADHGGIRWLLLTHRDHAHHHADFARRFPGCRRLIGAADVRHEGNEHLAATGDVEIRIGNGLQPHTLEGQRLSSTQAKDATMFVVPQPGHTPGSLCLSYRGRFLFTGDHLTYSRTLGQIAAFRLQCWEDWERQTRSVRYLRDAARDGWLSFSWILPGHGEWARLAANASPEDSAAALQRAVEWMDRQPKGHMPIPRWVIFVVARTRATTLLSRVVHGIGMGGDQWVLPRSVWSSLPDRESTKPLAAARLRLLLGAVGVGLLVALGLWLLVRS